MELYKWYKGDELPDRECDCVVVWNVEYDSPFYSNRTRRRKVETLGYVHSITNSKGDNILEFCESITGDDIFQEDIIAYMPIEFPEEVE